MRHLYGLRRRLKKGCRVSIILSFDCNYDCKYCDNKKNGKLPDLNEMAWHKLLLKIYNFPIKVREVMVSGGEPFLYPHFESMLICLSKKYFVTVFTNLSKVYNLKVNKKNVRFVATLHIDADRKKFLDNLRFMKKQGFRVDVKTFNNEIPSTKNKIHKFDDEKNIGKKFIFGPNGKLYLSKADMFC